LYICCKKYKFKIFGKEERHNKPHVHIFLSDGRNVILLLPDLSLFIGILSSSELKQIQDDLKNKVPELLEKFYFLNPGKKNIYEK